MLGGGNDTPTHEVTQVNSTHSLKFRSQVSNYRIKLKNVDGESYQQVCGNFVNVMKNILDDVLKNTRPTDMVRFHVSSSKFENGDINTEFQPRSQIAADYIAARIDKTMQSHNTIDMSDDFNLNVMDADYRQEMGFSALLILIWH